MKKLLLLVLIAMPHIQGLRTISDASTRFQDSLNGYLRNKTSVNAQKVVAEYDSTENSDKYRRTFDSTLSINRLNIDQLRGQVTTPAQTAQTPEQRASSRPVGRTSKPEEPIKGSDIIIDRTIAKPRAGTDRLVDFRPAQQPAGSDTVLDVRSAQTTTTGSALPVKTEPHASTDKVVDNVLGDQMKDQYGTAERLRQRSTTDRQEPESVVQDKAKAVDTILGNQMKDPHGTAERLRQRSTTDREEPRSAFQDESHERTFISTEEQHNKARYDAELDAQIQAAERAREEAELNEHNERDLRQRAVEERMMQRQMEVNER